MCVISERKELSGGNQKAYTRENGKIKASRKVRIALDWRRELMVKLFILLKTKIKLSKYWLDRQISITKDLFDSPTLLGVSKTLDKPFRAQL